MSTYWGYRCETCQVDTDMHWNHGKDILRRLAPLAPALSKLNELSGYIDVRVSSRSDEDIIAWLTRHEGHNLVLLNEYGETEPLEIVDV
jgi:hypothetical protein